MRAIPVLFSLLLIAAIGCGDPAVTENDTSNTTNTASTNTATANTATAVASTELDEVDAAGLESVLASNSVTLIEFTAVW